MKTLHIIIANKVATYLQRDGYIVCGNSDNQIEFTFDEEWKSYNTKTARFIWGGRYKDVQFTGNICPVPVVANTDRLVVGCYVDDLSTTTPAVIPCRLSILCGSNLVPEGTVVVPEGTPVLGEKTITENGEHYPDEGYDGFYKVTVKVADKQVIPPGYIKPAGTKEITENGTHNVTEFASVEVAVEGEGEVIPEISEVEDFTVFAGGADEGSLEIAYSVSQKVALPAANPALLATLDDENFIPENIKAGVNIFGLEGAYEAEGEELPDYTEAEDFRVMVAGQEGEVEISYDVSEKVALPAGHNRLASVSDENFIADNIKKGVSVFGLEGAYEGETVAQWDGTGVVIEEIEKEPQTVTFFIVNTRNGSTAQYAYEVGMTWGDFIASKYNTSGLVIKGSLERVGYIVGTQYTYIQDDTSLDNYVYSYNTIQSTSYYYWYNDGSDSN